MVMMIIIICFIFKETQNDPWEMYSSRFVESKAPAWQSRRVMELLFARVVLVWGDEI